MALEFLAFAPHGAWPVFQGSWFIPESVIPYNGSELPSWYAEDVCYDIDPLSP